MALPLDEGIKRRVDAYRDNPAALEKNYQMNQELLDLLALQKIKSEKDAAARELQMSQQQNPQTIAQQRGEEAINRTKEDIAKQVGGIAAQQQQQQQQRGGPPPGPPPGPQMAGIANQPAPNMARMAGGGIVTFQAGKEVSVTDNQLKRMGLTRDQWENTLTDEGREIYLRKFPALPAEASMARRFITGIGDFFDRPAAKEGAARKAQGYFGGARQIGAAFAPYSQGQQTLADLEAKRNKAGVIRNMQSPQGTVPALPLIQKDDFVPGAEGGEPVLPPIRQAGATSDPTNIPNYIPGTEGGEPVLPPTTGTGGTGGLSTITYRGKDPNKLQKGKDVKYNTLRDTPRGRDLTKNEKAYQDWLANQMKLNVGDSREAGIKRAGEVQNRAGIDAKYANMRAATEALNQQQAKERKDSGFYDLLSYGGGEGPLSNYARAATDRRRAEQLRQAADLAGEQRIEEAGIQADIGISGKQLLAGEKAAELTAQQKTAAGKSRGDLLRTQADNLTRDATNFLKADSENLRADTAFRQRQLTLSIANADGALKADIANMQGALESEANSIAAMVGRAKTKGNLLELLDKVNANMGTIGQKYDAKLADLIKTDTAIMKAKNENKLEEVNRLTAEKKEQWSKLRDATLRRYKQLQDLLMSRIAGGSGSGMNVVGSRPDS
tara:strand:- start:1522 stop:3522 length:2001 start_codon:yes stop_codon:yes gene_type:complete